LQQNQHTHSSASDERKTAKKNARIGTRKTAGVQWRAIVEASK